MTPSFSIVGIDPPFENMAKKVQVYAAAGEHTDQIPDLVVKLVNVLGQASAELEEEPGVDKRFLYMRNTKKITLFLVDDDVVFLKSPEIEFLEHGDFIIETFITGALCIANLARRPDVIILDYFLDGVDKSSMNGITSLDKIKAVNPDIPVIILSAQDKIEVAVNCMHHKAFDL